MSIFHINFVHECVYVCVCLYSITYLPEKSTHHCTATPHVQPPHHLCSQPSKQSLTSHYKWQMEESPHHTATDWLSRPLTSERGGKHVGILEIIKTSPKEERKLLMTEAPHKTIPMLASICKSQTDSLIYPEYTEYLCHIAIQYIIKS